MQFNSLAYNKYSSIQHKVPSQKLQKHTHRASNSFFALFVYRPKDSIRIFIVVFENFLSLKHSSIFSGWICLIFYSVQCNAMKMRYFPHCLCSDWMGQSKGKMNECFFRFLFFLIPRLDKFPNSLRPSPSIARFYFAASLRRWSHPISPFIAPAI